jgi:hypothetical protein
MKTDLEVILSTSYKADMISYMVVHPEAFDEAINLALKDNQPYSWRASWLLWRSIVENDIRVQPYINDIIYSLTTKSDDHQRELIKILQKMVLNNEAEGILFNVCVSVWGEIGKKPSVRFNAFKMIIKIAQNHPELINEIDFITENQYMDSLSSSAKKSIFKMIKGLK